MTPEQEYLEEALKYQTSLTFQILNKLGEMFFPDELTEFHQLVRKALEEVHNQTAAYMEAKHSLSKNEVDAAP